MHVKYSHSSKWLLGYQEFALSDIFSYYYLFRSLIHILSSTPNMWIFRIVLFCFNHIIFCTLISPGYIFGKIVKVEGRIEGVTISHQRQERQVLIPSTEF